MRMLATLCVVCRGWSREPLCLDCQARHAAPRPRCAHCAVAVPEGRMACGECLASPPPFARAVAAVDYAFPWSTLVPRFKRQAEPALAEAMARLMADAAAAVADRPALLLPMPLADARLRERGMNQAWELARRVGARLGIGCDARLLERRLDTPHLADLPRAERVRAVRGAFALAPGRATRIAAAHVAVVDDVLTTGATMAEAARVLLAAGAASVQAWVFARTPAPG